MLLLNSQNKITFDVNVQGTQNKPTVRCIIGDSPSFMYKAFNIDDSKYEVQMDLPKSMEPGEYPFKIEVLLNGKVLTPINKTITVQAAPVQAAPVQAAPVQAAPVQAAPVQAAPVQAAPVMKVGILLKDAQKQTMHKESTKSKHKKEVHTETLNIKRGIHPRIKKGGIVFK